MSAHSTADRNLLFGILALQMDFISRDQLVAGMSAWVLDKSTALGMVLVRQGTLAQANYDLLAPLVEAHIRRHNNDPEQSLAALTSASSARRDLRQLADAEVQASLAAVGHAGPEEDPWGTRPLARSGADSKLRFRVLRPHAEGGLGRVSVARDEELSREVALKEIKERYADDAESRTRFLREAEITGGLEHPGIVPVYSLGSYADGRPFYAMRFIRGNSLKEAIARFHKNSSTDSTDSTDKKDTDSLESVKSAKSVDQFSSLAFRQLLGRFVDVCNAVAYAHSRGVLHRDLKPGNIMLGKYGETLVVDWGLAKPLARPAKPGVETAVPGQPAPPTTARDLADMATLPPSAHTPASDSDQAAKTDSKTASVVSDPLPLDLNEPPLQPSSGEYIETVAGSAVGTPAFMSPEQAAGRIDLLGPASDIYSLGATLYCVLTGRAPFESTDIGVMLANVQLGEFPPPRQVQPGLDRALEAICLKAMSLHAADRYASARGLADDIEHWLADEPVSAWPEPWTVKMRRYVQRHQTLAAGVAAILFTAVIALSVSTVLVGEAH